MNQISIFRALMFIACCLAATGAVFAQEVTGQWAFDGSLAASIGQDIEYFDPSSTLGSQGKTTLGTCNGFGIPLIGGSNERVVKYNSYEVTEGLAAYSSASPNGGGTKVNQYTLIWDILFATSPTDWWALYQADPDNQPFSNDADFYYTASGGRLQPDNGLGILGDYQDATPPIELNTWYRIGCAVDLVARTMDKYVDGVRVGTTALDEGIDARWAIESASSELPFLLFTENFGDPDDWVGTGYVNNIQFRDYAMGASEMAALGGPAPGEISEIIPPTRTPVPSPTETPVRPTPTPAATFAPVSPDEPHVWVLDGEGELYLLPGMAATPVP